MLILLLLPMVAQAASVPVSELLPYQREIVDFAFKELAKDWGGDCKLRVATVDKFSELAVDGTLYMMDLTLVDHKNNAATCPASSPRSISVEVLDVGGSNERLFLGVSRKSSGTGNPCFGFAKLVEGPIRGCKVLREENLIETGYMYGVDLVLQCDGEPEDVCHMKVVVTPKGNCGFQDHLSTCQLN